MSEQRPRGEFDGPRYAEMASAKIVKLENQLQVLGEQLADKLQQREIEQREHVSREKDLRKELDIQRRKLIEAEEEIEELEELVSEQHKDLEALRGYRSTVDALRQYLEQREEEDRRLAAEHRQRSTLARWLAAAWRDLRNRLRM